MYDARNIAFNDIAINQKKGWFYNIGYNAIFQIDLETGELKLETLILEKNWKVQELFRTIVYFNEKLYLAPMKDKRICIYDLRNKEITFIDLDLEKYGEERNYNLAMQVEVIDNKVYFFPGRFHAIVKLNPEDNSLEYMDFWYKELSARWDDDKANLVISNRIHVKDAGWCIIPCWRANVILKVNVLSGEFSIIENDINGEVFDAVEIEDKYIGTFRNTRLLYEISDKGIVKIPLESENDSGCFICEYGSTLCVIPRFGTRMDIYDLNTYEKKMSYEFPDITSDSQKWFPYKNMSFCNKKIDDRRLVLYSNRSGEILIIDVSECSVGSIVPTMDDKTEKFVKGSLSELFKKTLFSENSNYKLKNFLETLNTIS